MDLELDDAARIPDFYLTLVEYPEGGLHIEMMSRTRGHLAGFPAWDHADRDLRHFTQADIPLGTEEIPFEDADEGWRILILAQGPDVFILEGDAPAGELTRRYRIPREQYLAAWEELIREYHPAKSLEDVLSGDDDQPDA
ncbi:MAG TPA: hypothetical protein VGQ21_21795 [Thermoanaerobaculia bacterium]|jgi:hypothetical protein|nr:hypothetical protein [Thermoanaerobaculia bacterium]